jgi:hypothetical protein
MNNMGREIMAALKRFQTGSDGDGVTVGGSLVVSGSTTANTFSATQITASGTIITAAGTNSAPAIVPTGDTNTGIFFPAADTIAFAEGGAEAMRIDSSGNVGIGTTSPTQRLTVLNNGTFGTLYQPAVQISNNSSGGTLTATGLGALVWSTDGNTTPVASIEAVRENPGVGAASALYFRTGSSGGGTTKAIIDSSGNVGIGTSSPTAPLHVAYSSNSYTELAKFRNTNTGTGGYCVLTFGQSASGSATGIIGTGASAAGNTAFQNTFAVGTQSNHPFTFITNDAERARITSGGDFLVGTTSNPGDYKIRASSSASGAAISTSSTTATVLDLQPNSDGTGQVAVVVYSQSAAAERLKIFSNGNVQNTNNSYGALSDIKIKENIVDATPKLEKLNQVRVVNFNIIGSEQKQIGVVAQELEQIFPSMVDESPDRDAEGNNLGTTTKSVKYSVFVPMLIKAIQELKAELDTVKAELATLKGN